MPQLINTVLVTYKSQGFEFVASAYSVYQKRRKNMCLNKNCCVPKVIIKAYTVGATFALNTAYSFANTKNCDKLLLVLQASIPSQLTIVPVTVVTSSGVPAVLPLVNCLGNNVMSDQLVGVASLCVAFGSNVAHLRVLKAFDECGNEICLRPSAFYETVEI